MLGRTMTHQLLLPAAPLLLVSRLSSVLSGMTRTGSAYVYRRQFNGFFRTFEDQKLVPEDAEHGDRCGEDVAYGGETLLIGASSTQVENVDRQGAAYVFE